MFPPSAEVSGVKVAKELCILSKEHAVSEKGKEKMNETNKRLKGGQKQAYKHYSKFSSSKAILFFFFVYRRPTNPNFWHFQKKKKVTT